MTVSFQNPISVGGSINVGIRGPQGEPPDLYTDLTDIREFGDTDGDISELITAAIAEGKTPYVPPGRHYFASAITLDRPTKIIFGNGPSWASVMSFRQTNTYRDDRTVLWTDQNIPFFIIESTSVHLVGGVFDCSAVTSHSRSVFEYRPFWTNTEPYRETRGQYDGSITDFWVVGNSTTLSNAGNGTGVILLDWVNSPSNTFLYFHKWQGRADYVRAGFAETMANQDGKSGQNSTWNECDLKIWGAKQAILTNLQTRSEFKLKFQAQYGLHSTEVDAPVVELNSSQNQVDCQFYDMGIAPSGSNYSNSKTLKAVPGNFIKQTTPQESYGVFFPSVETGLVQQPAAIGYAALSRTPSAGVTDFLISELANQLVGFDQRGTFTWASKRVGEVDPSNKITISFSQNLFKQQGFRPSFDFAADADTTNDYLELDLDWTNTTMLRPTLLSLALTGVNTVATGIRSYQIVQYGVSDNELLNKTFNLDSTIGAFNATRNIRLGLVATTTKRIVIRLFGTYSVGTSYAVQEFAIFDDRRVEACYLPSSGGHVAGTLTANALQVKDAGGTLRTIQPKTAGTPADLTALVALLKTTGILT